VTAAAAAPGAETDARICGCLVDGRTT